MLPNGLTVLWELFTSYLLIKYLRFAPPHGFKTQLNRSKLTGPWHREKLYRVDRPGTSKVWFGLFWITVLVIPYGSLLVIPHLLPLANRTWCLPVPVFDQLIKINCAQNYSKSLQKNRAYHGWSGCYGICLGLLFSYFCDKLGFYAER